LINLIKIFCINSLGSRRASFSFCSVVEVAWVEVATMENLTISEIAAGAFHFFSHNSSYAIPGFHDLDVLDASWVLSTTLIFFTIQTGLALLEAGIISGKNKVNVLMRHMVDICAGGVSFWIFGFALMYGRGEFTNPFFGLGDFFVNTSASDPLSMQLFTMYFFQMSFAMTATSIVSGAVSERFRYIAYIPFSFMMTIVYAVGAGWVWGQHGWLRNIGVIDFAGTGPIHIIGGASCRLISRPESQLYSLKNPQQLSLPPGTSGLVSVAMTRELHLLPWAIR
jgi:ammonium transporter, Amt family